MNAFDDWEHFDHGADIGVRGFGDTKEMAFARAALATTAVVANPETVAAKESVEVARDAPDDELLLVEWLNAVLLEMAQRKMLFSRFEITLSGHHLAAKIWGERLDLLRHQPAVEIKGATFTELRVRRDANGRWLAQCVVDV